MHKINLLPPELQRDVSIDFKTLAIRASVTVTAMAVLAFYCTFLHSIYSIKNEISQKEIYLSEIQSTVKIVEEIKNQRLADEQSVQKYRELVSKRKLWSPMLEDLNCILPADMWLEGINISYVEQQPPGGIVIMPATPPVFQPGPQAQALQGQLQVKPVPPDTGVTQDGQKGTQPVSSLPTPNTLTMEGYSRTMPSVGVFVHNLGKMPYFVKATINEIGEDDKSAAFKFKITATIKESGQ